MSRLTRHFRLTLTHTFGPSSRHPASHRVKTSRAPHYWHALQDTLPASGRYANSPTRLRVPRHCIRWVAAEDPLPCLPTARHHMLLPAPLHCPAWRRTGRTPPSDNSNIFHMPTAVVAFPSIPWAFAPVGQTFILRSAAWTCRWRGLDGCREKPRGPHLHCSAIS